MKASQHRQPDRPSLPAGDPWDIPVEMALPATTSRVGRSLKREAATRASDVQTQTPSPPRTQGVAAAADRQEAVTPAPSRVPGTGGRDALAEARAETQRLRRELEELRELEAVTLAAPEVTPAPVAQEAPAPVAAAVQPSEPRMPPPGPAVLGPLAAPEPVAPHLPAAPEPLVLPAAVPLVEEAPLGVASSAHFLAEPDPSLEERSDPYGLSVPARASPLPPPPAETATLVWTARAHAENMRLERELRSLRAVAQRQRGEVQWLHGIKAGMAAAMGEQEHGQREHAIELEHDPALVQEDTSAGQVLASRLQQERLRKQERSLNRVGREIGRELQLSRSDAVLPHRPNVQPPGEGFGFPDLEQEHLLSSREREVKQLEQAEEFQRQRILERERTLRQRELSVEAQRERARRHERELEQRERELLRERQMERERELGAKARAEELERQHALEQREREIEHIERNSDFERERMLERERTLLQRAAKLEVQRELARQQELALSQREKELQSERECSAERKLQHETELERERVRELERECELERERIRQLERERERSIERKLGHETELERERSRELQRERSHELERDRELERERGRELKLERELERERVRQLERERELERERRLQRERELERERQLMREHERGLDLDRERHLEQGRQPRLELEHEPQHKRPESEAQTDAPASTPGRQRFQAARGGHRLECGLATAGHRPRSEASGGEPEADLQAAHTREPTQQQRAADLHAEPEAEADAEASSAAEAAAAAAAALENKRLRRELEGLRALAQWQQGEVGAAIAYSGMAVNAAVAAAARSGGGPRGGPKGPAAAFPVANTPGAVLSAVSDSELSGPQLAQLLPEPEAIRHLERDSITSPPKSVQVQHNALQAGIEEYDRTVRTLMSRVLGRSGELWSPLPGQGVGRPDGRSSSAGFSSGHS